MKPEQFVSYWRTFLGKGVWNFAEKIAYKDIFVSEESKNNILKLKEHLEKVDKDSNKKGSALIITNHISADDVPLELAYFVSGLGPSIKKLTIPIGKKHIDGRENKFYQTMLKMTPYVGLNTPPIIQHYDMKTYSVEDARNLRGKAFEQVNDTLLTQGGVVFYAPEGTRSKTGKLGEFKKGIGDIAIKYNNDELTKLLMAPRAIVVPAIIVPAGKYSRGINMRYISTSEGFEIRIGQPFHLSAINENKKAGEIAKGLRSYLASFLPDNMRGTD